MRCGSVKASNWTWGLGDRSATSGLVANRPVDGGNAIQGRIGQEPPVTLVDVLPGVTTEAVAVDGSKVVVRVDRPFHALAVLDLNGNGHAF